MRFDELNWMDIERYLYEDCRVILVIGSCEQHGYLSMLTDVKIPLAIADAASELTGVLVAPPLNFGSSPYFLSYPGTISLRISTLLDVTEDIIRSLYQQGFRKFLLLNGHGGNDAIRSRLFELASELDEILIRWYAWWTSHSLLEIASKYEIKPAHANWLEAFPFTKVGNLPTSEKYPPKVPGLIGAKEARQLYGDGSFGGPYETEGSVMDEIFDSTLKDVIELLKFAE